MLLSLVADDTPDLHFLPLNMVTLVITLWFYCNSSTVVFPCAVKPHKLYIFPFCKEFTPFTLYWGLFEEGWVFHSCQLQQLTGLFICMQGYKHPRESQEKKAKRLWKSSFKWPRYWSHLERWGIMLHLECLALPKATLVCLASSAALLEKLVANPCLSTHIQCPTNTTRSVKQDLVLG